jgi:hypothetical protein
MDEPAFDIIKLGQLSTLTIHASESRSLKCDDVRDESVSCLKIGHSRALAHQYNGVIEAAQVSVCFLCIGKLQERLWKIPARMITN